MWLILQLFDEPRLHKGRCLLRVSAGTVLGLYDGFDGPNSSHLIASAAGSRLAQLFHELADQALHCTIAGLGRILEFTQGSNPFSTRVRLMEEQG